MTETDPIIYELLELREELRELLRAERAREETGEWTPAFTGTSTAGVYTYSNQAGDYIKIGKLVIFAGRLTITAIGTPPVGNMTITGLPYTSASDFERGVVHLGRVSQLNNAASTVQLTGFVNSSNTNIALEETFDNGAAVAVAAANFTNTATDIIFSGFYVAA